MRNLPVLSGMLLFVFAQMSSPDVNAHHSAHFSNASSHELLTTVKPITIMADTLRFCTDLDNAELPASNQVYLGEGHPDASSCSAHIWTTQSITDDCGGNVIYDVRLYLNNGIDFIQIVDPTAVALDLNEQAVLTFDTRSSSLPAGDEISLHGVPYTSGSCAPLNSHHRLLWTVVNACDETVTYDYLIRVEDCEKPVPICVGLSSVVIPSSGSVTILAKDFDSLMSNDDCTPRDSFLFSFQGEEYQPMKSYTCAEFCTQGLSYLEEIWIADKGTDLNCDGEISWSERNKDFCTTFIVFDDNGPDICECFSHVGGRVRTPMGAGIPDVTVNLYLPTGEFISQTTTNELGYYEFQFINPLLTYRFEPVKDDNHKHGVSTLDLVLLQKHMLNLMPFDSPFEYIAADANNSESVSALDLVEIRKLIIGLYTEFPKNESWRFVPENFEFQNPFFNPWPFPGDTVTNTIDGFPNFIGVKVGDIHSANNLTTIEVRNAPEILSLFIEDQFVNAGDFVEVPVFNENISALLGMQFTMQMLGLKYEGVQPGLMNLSGDGIANHDNAIALSWAGISPISLENQTALFTLRFRAEKKGRLQDMLELNSSITKSEAYREADVATSGVEDIEVLNVQLRIGSMNSDAQSNRYQLNQNIPNPFTEQTVIGFHLPWAMTATIGIFNVFGQEIYQITSNFDVGYNTVTLHKDLFKSPGIYGYFLKTRDMTLSKTLLLSD